MACAQPNPLSAPAREIQQEEDGWPPQCRSGHENYFYLFLHKKTRGDKEPEGEQAQPWALGKSTEGVGPATTLGTRGTRADEFRGRWSGMENVG